MTYKDKGSYQSLPPCSKTIAAKVTYIYSRLAVSAYCEIIAVSTCFAYRALQHTATLCTATHCNTLQHTATHLFRDYSDTGWRGLIGSPRLQIIFHKRATKYRSLLQKTTYKDKGSYESLPPCFKTIALQFRL